MTMNGVAVLPLTAGASVAPAAATALFRSMGEPTRLALLLRLNQGEARVSDLVAAVGLAQSTVSAHLLCLRECGLVTSRPQGRASVFSLACAPELSALLAAAERLLARTGDAVELCSTYGTDAVSSQASGSTQASGSDTPTDEMSPV